jgi:hypothetical protein
MLKEALLYEKLAENSRFYPQYKQDGRKADP